MKAKYLLFAILTVFISTTLIAQPVQESGYDPGAARNDLSNVEPSAVITIINESTATDTPWVTSISDLSGVTDKETARTNIEVYSKTESDSLAAQSALRYYFTETPSDIEPYEYFSLSSVAQASDELDITTVNTLEDRWITPAGTPHIATMVSGIYEVSTYITKTGQGTAYMSFELMKRTAGGVETSISSSTQISLTGTFDKQLVTSKINVDSAVSLNLTDRLILNLYSYRVGVADLIFWYGGNTDAYFGVPLSPRNFLRTDGSNPSDINSVKNNLQIPNNASFTLTDLSDVPDIAGNADKVLKLNSEGDAFEWGDGGISGMNLFADIDDATIATGAGTGYGATLWGGAVVMPNNKIITTMQRADNYVIYDPSANICTNKVYGGGDWKFQGNGLVIDNKVYFCPNAWDTIGIYNVDTDTMSLGASVGGDNQYIYLCKITNDLLLVVPGTNNYFKEYTISTNVASQTGYKGATTQYMFTSGYYVESVDKVILSPRRLGNIGIYNVIDKTFSSGVALTGLGHDSWSDAFCGIYNGTGTNELLLMPNYVTKVCAYNYVSNTIRVVYDTGLAASTFTKSFQLEDGRIFLYGATKTAIYNPEDNTFDLGPEFDTSGYGGVAEVDGRIAFIPNASSTVKLIDLKYSIYNGDYKMWDSNNDDNFLKMDANATFAHTLDVATLTVGGVDVLGDVSAALDAILGN